MERAKLILNTILLLLITTFGVILTFCMIKYDGLYDYSCPKIITQMQMDSISEVLELKKQDSTYLNKEYEYHNGVIVKLTSQIKQLKNEINELEEKIKEAEANGINSDNLKMDLLEKQQEYQKSIERLANETRKNSALIETKPSILDSLNKVLEDENIKKDSLETIYNNYKNCCNE